jgi:CheY-like chemotaxis protein
MTGDFSCPYCGRPLHWVPNRWLRGSGSFECANCGDFPDYRPKGNGDAPVAASTDAYRDAAGYRLHVLVVDDSLSQAELYAFMLDGVADVTVATDGAAGLAFAVTTPPDVMLLDLLMPGLSGWDVCQQMKANPTTASIPIVILTGLDGVDVPARARAAGATAVLMKPCPVERLLLTVERAARERVGRTS